MQANQRFGLLTDGEKKFIDRPLLLILSGAFYFFINIVIWNLIYLLSLCNQSRKQQMDTLQLESLVKELS